MTAPAKHERLPVGTDIWYCYSNFITCSPRHGQEHLLRFYETGYRADLRGLAGHAFLECRQCQPSSFIFAVFSPRPSPMVTCYAISREAFEEWEKNPSDETLSTPEMLYRLRDPENRSYNPHWRQPR